MGAAEGVSGAARSAPSRPIGSSNSWARSAGSGGGAAGGAAGGGAVGGTAGGAADGVARGAADVAVFQGAGLRSSKEELFSCEGRRFWFADAANQKEPASIRAGAATATTAAEPWERGGTGSVARLVGSGGGAASCAVGATDGAARVGGGVGVTGSGGWNRPGTTAVLVGAGGRHGAEVGAQARIPHRPLAGSGVTPALYAAFSASGSAFQRWPGAWQGAGERAREEGLRRGLGTGGMRKACGAREGAIGLRNVLLALGAEADSGGAALLGGTFLGGALGGAEDAPASCSAACWTSTAKAHAAALAGVAAEGDVGA
eukprot:scaffold25797_cov55-Phaeocystis_antarctica.AAC.2